MASQLDETLGERLTAEAKALGVLMPDLVERLEAQGVPVSERTLTRIRSGSGTTVARVVAIAQALQVSVSDLLLDPTGPDWSVAWALSDAAAKESAVVVRMVRLVDNAARRYRDAMARLDLAPTDNASAAAQRDAAEALSDLSKLHLEAMEQWPDAPADDIVPSDLREPLVQHRSELPEWIAIYDEPNDKGWADGVLKSPAGQEVPVRFNDRTMKYVPRIVAESDEESS